MLRKFLSIVTRVASVSCSVFALRRSSHPIPLRFLNCNLASISRTQAVPKPTPAAKRLRGFRGYSITPFA